MNFARLSCSTICFRHFPLAEALAAIRGLGFTHADIGTLPGFCDHHDFVHGTPAQERAFIAAVRESGVRVHTFTTNITEPNAPDFSLATYLAAGRRNIAVAAELGAAGIVLNCGAPIERPRESLERAIAQVGAAIGQLAPEAEAAGVRLMIEAPHKNKLCRDAIEAQALLKACGHENVQLIVDINHYHAAGWRPTRVVETLGARNIGIVHLRDAVGRENRFPLGAGEVDFPELFRALRAGGYAGRYAFEFTNAAPTLEGNVDMLRRSLDYIRPLLA
jgi:myo-inositol catabolism protein IolH